MTCRYERTANDMLAKSTIAGQEGVITYLANAAALQQFEQTALAYVLMSEAGRSMGASGLGAAAESLLEGKFEVNSCCICDKLIACLRYKYAAVMFKWCCIDITGAARSYGLMLCWSAAEYKQYICSTVCSLAAVRCSVMYRKWDLRNTQPLLRCS